MGRPIGARRIFGARSSQNRQGPPKFSGCWEPRKTKLGLPGTPEIKFRDLSLASSWNGSKNDPLGHPSEGTKRLNRSRVYLQFELTTFQMPRGPQGPPRSSQELLGASKAHAPLGIVSGPRGSGPQGALRSPRGTMRFLQPNQFMSTDLRR